MVQNLDFIHVPKADLNEGSRSGKITKSALYFTKEYLFVLPYESLQVLLAGMESTYNEMDDFVIEINATINEMDIDSFHNLLLNKLKPERIFRISELEKFAVQVGFWIFGGIRLRKRGGEMQVFNIQPAALREEIKRFYDVV